MAGSNAAGKVILGIDPGSRRTGYGVIQKQRGTLVVLAAGTIDVQAGSEGRALFALRRRLVDICNRYRPDLVVVERLYFTKNRKTAIEVAQARGIILEVTEERRIGCREVSPTQLKALVTGYGRADKETVARAIGMICGTSHLRFPDDATDALALAVIGASAGTS